MADDQQQREPIQPPSSDKKREVTRALAEGGVSLVPGGGAVARVLRTTHPPKSEADRKQWQAQISDRTNENTGRLDEHERKLSPNKTTVSGAVAELVSALAQSCPDGLLCHRYMRDQVRALLPDEEASAVDEAAFELNSLGLVEIERFIGPQWMLRLTQHFYEQVDHQVMGWNTKGDARALARLLLEDQQRECTALLHEASGWDKRRFNPAFRVLTDLITAGWVSKEIQADYAAASIGPLPEDRARMRRFIQLEDVA